MNLPEASPHKDVSDRKDTATNSTRRGFLKVAVGILAAVNGLLLGIPFLKTLLTPPKTPKPAFFRAGDLGGLPVGKPVEIRFVSRVQDAFYHREELHMAWVVLHNDGSVTVFSPVCPHLGCYYDWNPQAGEFQCPCHGSIFSENGKVLGGPAPRPLDTLPHRMENNILYVSWVNYQPGISSKVVV